jgi:hypothetical protein
VRQFTLEKKLLFGSAVLVLAILRRVYPACDYCRRFGGSRRWRLEASAFCSLALQVHQAGKILALQDHYLIAPEVRAEPGASAAFSP